MTPKDIIVIPNKSGTISRSLLSMYADMGYFSMEQGMCCPLGLWRVHNKPGR